MSETHLPKISADECLVKVIAIGVNRADILQREGKYPPPPRESTILGLEVSGEIVMCGANAGISHKGKLWQEGDRVFGLVAGGAYAQFVKVKASHLIRLPNRFSFEQGAACAEVFLTAYQSLFTIASLKSNHKVLIHAGASGVGSAAIQLAKAKGCFVVSTVGNDKKLQACLSLGADVALNYHEVDFVTWSKEHVKTGFNVIVDVVAGDYVSKNLNVASLDGKIVILSMLGGRYCQKLDLAKMLGKRLTLSASTLRNRSNDYKTQLIINFIDDFYSGLENGIINPTIDTIYSWEDAEQAHNQINNNNNIGKLVLLVS